MKVYVVESGSYNDRVITGAWSSLEKAMRGTELSDWRLNEDKGGRWWTYINDPELDDALTIWEFEVDGE